ncbi:hypothetical protein M0802_016209 [Mischocyttarus mexicanus]|nr:hypothetical protein M0802_016209 [Mischocyttarus mexicanus]
MVYARQLKDKTRFSQDKSTTVRVFFSKNIKRLRQGFLSEKLRLRQGFLSEKFRINQHQLDFFLVQALKVRVMVFSAKSEGYLKDKTRFSQDKSTTVGVFLSKNFKKSRQGFLSEKLK